MRGNIQFSIKSQRMLSKTDSRKRRGSSEQLHRLQKYGGRRDKASQNYSVCKAISFHTCPISLSLNKSSFTITKQPPKNKVRAKLGISVALTIPKSKLMIQIDAYKTSSHGRTRSHMRAPQSFGSLRGILNSEVSSNNLLINYSQGNNQHVCFYNSIIDFWSMTFADDMMEIDHLGSIDVLTCSKPLDVCSNYTVGSPNSLKRKWVEITSPNIFEVPYCAKIKKRKMLDQTMVLPDITQSLQSNRARGTCPDFLDSYYEGILSRSPPKRLQFDWSVACCDRMFPPSLDHLVVSQDVGNPFEQSLENFQYHPHGIVSSRREVYMLTCKGWKVFDPGPPLSGIKDQRCVDEELILREQIVIILPLALYCFCTQTVAAATVGLLTSSSEGLLVVSSSSIVGLYMSMYLNVVKLSDPEDGSKRVLETIANGIPVGMISTEFFPNVFKVNHVVWMIWLIAWIFVRWTNNCFHKVMETLFHHDYVEDVSVSSVEDDCYQLELTFKHLVIKDSVRTQKRVWEIHSLFKGSLESMPKKAKNDGDFSQLVSQHHHFKKLGNLFTPQTNELVNIMDDYACAQCHLNCLKKLLVVVFVLSRLSTKMFVLIDNRQS